MCNEWKREEWYFFFLFGWDATLSLDGEGVTDCACGCGWRALSAVKAPVAVVAGGDWGCGADGFISFWGMGCAKSFDMPCRYQPNEKTGPVRAIRNKNTKT